LFLPVLRMQTLTIVERRGGWKRASMTPLSGQPALTAARAA